PRKEEVRFVNPRQIYAVVRHVLRDGLARTRGGGEAGLPDPRPASPGILETRPWRPPEPVPLGPRTFSLAPPPTPAVQLPVFAPGASSAAGSLAPLPDHRANGSAATDSVGLAPRPGAFASLVPAGQLFLTYLICEGEDRVVLIDQHAAHERVVYEDLRAALRSGSLPSQGLLEPLPVPLQADLLAVLEEERDALGLLGFDAEPFGPDRGLLRAHPAALRGDPVEALRETLAVLSHGRGGERAVVERGLETVACHSAIRAGKRVSDAEVRALLCRMDEVDFGDHCPHGRPAWTVITKAELERMFGRR
ncbi:MAG: hypothetical protein JXB32_00240, partial [Deltaproteobacteria bacterium]|nr:hypothetical protein [Deltaproteobacteria bacterium]